jgi:hypothetical protein
MWNFFYKLWPGKSVLNPEGRASTEWKELLGGLGWWADSCLPLSCTVGRVLGITKSDLLHSNSVTAMKLKVAFKKSYKTLIYNKLIKILTQNDSLYIYNTPFRKVHKQVA